MGEIDAKQMTHQGDVTAVLGAEWEHPVNLEHVLGEVLPCDWGGVDLGGLHGGGDGSVETYRMDSQS